MAEETEDASATETLAEEIILVALLLLRYNSYLRRRALLRLETLRDEILRETATLDLTAHSRAIQVQSIDDALSALVQAAYTEIERDLRRDLLMLVQLVSDLIATRIDAAVGLRGTGQRLSADSRDNAVSSALIEGAAIAAWLSTQAGNLLFTLRRSLNAAAANRAKATEITEGVREAVETAQRQAMPVIRTAVTAVFGSAMVATVRANPRTLQGWLHVSVLDSKTTETCKKRANCRFLADGTPVGHKQPFRIPPLHMGCRSHLSPWFYTTKDMHPAAAAAIVAAGAEAAFADKPVVEPTLDEWLARRPVKDQQAILGAAKWKAWREGTITTASLLDQSGRPLTIEQIRRLLGL